ncbi:MAG: hypothetical protein ACI9DK_003282 [Vicingaceae bacterium]|jgi:hypothetical protein
MEAKITKAFRMLFILLALAAFVGVCIGATHQVIMLLICLIAQAFCVAPKAVKV